MDLMRLLLTGSTGFLGSALHPRLVRAGWEVSATSKRQTDLEESLPPGLPARADAVIHLAPTSPASLERLVAWAAGAGAQVFLFASSGNAKDPPPEDLYGRWKRMAEESLLRAALPRVLVLRLHTLFGPGERPERLIPRLRASVLVELAAPDGVRLTPTHVQDAAEAFVRCLGDPKLAGIFDVAGPEALTLGQIARRLGKPVRTRPLKPGERDLAGDPEPLFRATGFRPARALSP